MRLLADTGIHAMDTTLFFRLLGFFMQYTVDTFHTQQRINSAQYSKQSAPS